MIEKSNNTPILVHSSLLDLTAIAKVHQSAFPKHLSSALGRYFISKTLEWYLNNSHFGFLLHLEINGKVIGYATGFYKDVSLKHGSATTIAQYVFKAALISFILRPWLIFHPEIRKKWTLILKQFRLKLVKSDVTKNEVSKKIFNNARNTCSLLSIGVMGNFKGKGFGSILIKGFEKEAVKRFHVEYLELSVNINNLQAQKAYQKNGWQIKTQKGNEYVMFKKIN